MLLLGIAATNSVTLKEDDGHKIKQAVNCMGPELLFNNAPPLLHQISCIFSNNNDHYQTYPISVSCVQFVASQIDILGGKFHFIGALGIALVLL